MLRIGERVYELVQAQSGFRVTLDPGETGDFWRQRWRFDAQYVPAPGDPGPPLLAFWEYQRVLLYPLWLSLTDWRDLTTYHPVDHGVKGFYPKAASVENLLARAFGSDECARIIDPDEFRVLRREGYLFSCEFDGLLPAAAAESPPDAPAESAEPSSEHLHLHDEIPFTEVTVRVPINSADPVSAARAIVARELNLTNIARSHLRPYDPARGHYRSRTLGTDKHSVLLETPWRTGTS